MAAGVIAQVRFVELFFENSGVNDDQSGEFGNYSIEGRGGKCD